LYSLAIDLDDFFRIKDLTRVKTGLTLEGITILEDDKDKFIPQYTRIVIFVIFK